MSGPEMSRRGIRAAASGLAAAGLVALATGPASAHIRVIGDVIPGKPATVTFRVPAELKEATTVRVAVTVPAAVKVSKTPMLAGWKTQLSTDPRTGGTRVVWTAKAGHEVKPEATGRFTLSLGALPNVRSLTFPTEQVYSNGNTAAWTQEKKGAAEPAFPAPALVVNPSAPAPTPSKAAASASTASDSASPVGVTGASAPQAAADQPAPADSGSHWVKLAGAAVGAAAIALVAQWQYFRAKRRKDAPQT